MCGIAGFYGKGSERDLVEMTRTLRYRGPDDEGFYFDNEVGLGQRRLSIIDLSPAGHQPMSNEDDSIWISFNGEIYNFVELRKSLKKPHKFKGNSDTEVIIHLYEEIGEKVFEQLQGMFAISLFDKHKKSLYLARDRFGKKPLYWTFMDNTLIFGSELKALNKHPGFKKELDITSLQQYLWYEYVPSPRTIYRDVFKLEPGHYVIFDGQNIKKKKFWDISFEENKDLDFNSAVSGLDALLFEAVKKRLISDVPLGVFLSGGIDSSTIAYYAQRICEKKIKTFSIAFEENSFDESKYARLVAKKIGSDHYEKKVSAKDALKIIPIVAELMDEPIADSSILPTYLLSKFTREHVTVALGGDGADEIFCGYPTFQAHKLARIYRFMPKSVNQSLFYIINHLPASFNYFSLDFKIKKFLSGFSGPEKYRDQTWLGSFSFFDQKKLLTPDIYRQLNENDVFEPIERNLRNAGEIGYYQKLIYLYLRMYMMENVLVKVDRASMYNSLEVRAPFLDAGVADFAGSLPIRYKLKNYRVKHILKELMKDKLPPEILKRRKKGFALPLAEWLAGPLAVLCGEVFDKNKIEKQGIFNRNYIENLLKEHQSRKRDNRKLIWTLLMFQLWFDRWLK